ncbi:hypothetical protein C8F01DRAFT_1091162 [Mycena amicta]|nr:hypothetical protein C8F01DRAFT_1091162 [Mycena amicta]
MHTSENIARRTLVDAFLLTRSIQDAARGSLHHWAPASPTTSTTPTSTSSASSGSTSGSPRTTPSPSSPTFPPELIALYATRRILTVNGFCADRPLSVQAAHIDAERAGGTRMVDRFVGHTMFAGLVPLPADGNYQVELIVPQRYLLAPPTPPSPQRREVSHIPPYAYAAHMAMRICTS